MSDSDTIRVYNLSQKTTEEAEFLYKQLAPYVTYPFLMPDGKLRPSLFIAETA